MKLTRNGMAAVAIAAAFFAGSVVAMAVAGDSAQTAKKKKKVKRGPAGPAGPAGAQGPQGPPGSANVVPIDYASSTATTETILSANGFTLNASCPGGADSLYTTAGAGALYIKWTSFASSADGTNTSGGESDSYTKATDDAGITDILGSDDVVADGTMIYDTNGRGAPGGKPISIVFHAEESGGSCAFSGTATISS